MGQREAIRAIRALGNALEHMTRGSDQRIELELALFSLSEPPQQVAVQAVPAARPAVPAQEAPRPFASAPVKPFVCAPAHRLPCRKLLWNRRRCSSLSRNRHLSPWNRPRQKQQLLRKKSCRPCRRNRR